MNKRRGFSLIEMVTVMATGAALTAVAVGLLYVLMRLQDKAHEEAAQQTALGQLAEQFRRDVRAAGEFTSRAAGDDSPATWELSLEAGRVVEYRVDDRSLDRVERAEEGVVRRESFALPDGAAVSIERAGGADSNLLSLRIDADLLAPKRPSWRSFQVDALLAKDRRFVKAP